MNDKTLKILFTISPVRLCTPYGAVGKADVQNPLDFVTALLSAKTN
ncbi:hypothetical protein HYE54_00205 [Aggregatibacter actinomycetemcomitans]|nr:hypothetical protein [Aggregatibacter actinomycetemcomitans]MBN6067247.1 hypothetical protein [Aggregatibacter actinomycetemcomitans]MBN6084840.1 hypothetical protein [Aggregatibacter actinomycetemcomitans]